MEPEPDASRAEIQKWILDQHQHSGTMIYTRSNFFLLAQSMTLVSYASIYGNSHTCIELIISFLGFFFALAWAVLGTRDNRNMNKLYKSLLEEWGRNGKSKSDRIFTKLLGWTLGQKHLGPGWRLPLIALVGWTLFIVITSFNYSLIIKYSIVLVLFIFIVLAAIYTFCLSNKEDIHGIR